MALLLLLADYIVQDARFMVFEEIGCLPSYDPSVLSIIIIVFLPVLLPIIATLFYCRKCCLAFSNISEFRTIWNLARIMWTFHRHNKVAKEFLSSSSSANPRSYFRYVILGGIDMIVFLPIQIICFVVVCQVIRQTKTDNIYSGWTTIHSDWEPFSIPEKHWKSMLWTPFNLRCSTWAYALIGILFFLLFGLAAEARTSYSRVFWAVASRFGYVRAVQAKESDIEFQPKFVTSMSAITSDIINNHSF